MSSGSPILLLESDRNLGEMLARELAADDFSVRLARSTDHARSLAAQGPLTLAVLGGSEQPGEARTFLSEIRSGGDDRHRWENRDLPIVVLGDGSSALEVLRAFDAGADDFLARPVSYLELRARLRAILRRSSNAPRDRVLRVGALGIDLDSRTVTVHDHAIELCRTEFELLAQLAREPGRVLTRSELLFDIWGRGAAGSSRTLDTHASRLRRKLGAVSAEQWIPSVRGVGYRLI